MNEENIEKLRKIKEQLEEVLGKKESEQEDKVEETKTEKDKKLLLG